MKELIEVYNIRNNKSLIELAQKSSLNKDSEYGLKQCQNLLFGTKEWFNAIEDGTIPKIMVKGKISRVFDSGHNDYPQFEIENDEGKSVWTREGNDIAYKLDRYVELFYVEQISKRVTGAKRAISKCIIQIKISTE